MAVLEKRITALTQMIKLDSQLVLRAFTRIQEKP
jgi:hypothetical protein